MDPAFEAFHSGLIDFAGLFPPAEQELDAALRTFEESRHSADAWMLERFVCPTTRLREVAQLRGGASERPLPISALARTADSSGQLLDTLAADFDDIEWFFEETGGMALIDQMELRLPPKPENLVSLLGEVAELFAARAPLPVTLFLETAAARHMERLIPETIERVAEFRVALAGKGVPSTRLEDVGVKVRCGGVIAAAYPDDETVRSALVEAHRHGVVLKATAGLHHPLRHYRDDLQVDEHGFWNVFGAGVLLHALDCDEKTVAEILTDGDPSHFGFEGGAFRWLDLEVTAEQIQAARQEAVTSFGSCSFSEPREDLARLGYPVMEDAVR